MKHQWIESTLGHGEYMCANCLITNREALVLNKYNKCEAANEEADFLSRWRNEMRDAF